MLKQYALALITASASLLAGAATVHYVYKPSTEVPIKEALARLRAEQNKGDKSK